MKYHANIGHGYIEKSNIVIMRYLVIYKDVTHNTYIIRDEIYMVYQNEYYDV